MNIPDCKELKKAIELQENILIQLRLEKVIIETIIKLISSGGQPVVFNYYTAYEEKNIDNIKKIFTDKGFTIDTLKQDSSGVGKGFIVRI